MWNYRLCKETVNNIAVYSLKEVYYNKNGEIWAVTENPASFVIDDLSEEEMMQDFTKTIQLMNLAKEKPIVDLDTIVFASNDF